jgi:hypothetical protein
MHPLVVTDGATDEVNTLPKPSTDGVSSLNGNQEAGPVP